MARETKEARFARQQADAEAALAASLEYRKTVPALLMDMQAIAQQVGVSTSVSLTPTGPSVKFYDDASNINDTVTYDTEQWEIEYLQRKLRDLLEALNFRIVQRSVAEDAWANKLASEERAAIKVTIHYLR